MLNKILFFDPFFFHHTPQLKINSKLLAYFTDNAYSPEEVKYMTENILLTLNFELYLFTPKKVEPKK